MKSNDFLGICDNSGVFLTGLLSRGHYNLNNNVVYSKDNIYIWSLNKGSRYYGVFILVYGVIVDILSDKEKFSSDVKVEFFIITLYKKYGEEFVKLLDGRFLIILHDETQKKSYVFNNRYLNTRFYYYLDNKKIIFANRIKTLLRNLSEPPLLNKKAIISFLNSGYSYSEKTFFEKIFQLIPGYYLTFHSNQIVLHKYSGLVFNRRPVKNLENKIDEYESLFLSMIEKNIKLDSHTKLGCQLSGGTDSAWIYLNASKMYKKDIQAYTCYYEQPLFNEVEKAKKIIDLYGGMHRKILIVPKDLDCLPAMIRIAEEPVLSTALAIYRLIQEAGKDVNMLLTGDGGDSFFGGFYPVAEFHKYMQYTPYVFRKFLHLIFLFLAKITDWERLYECEHIARAFALKNFYNDFYENLVSYRHFNKTMRNKLLNPSFFTDPIIDECADILSVKKESFFDDLINTKCVYGIMQYQLTWEDKFCEHYGIDLIAPYFDKKIMDFLCSLPIDYLARGNHLQRLTHTAIQRWFQKQALKRYFPEEFVMRQNQPFDQPFHAWFEARPKIFENLLKSLMNRGWFNNSYLEKIYKEHKKQKLHKSEYCELKNHGHRIFSLLALEVWAREFLDSSDYTDKYEERPLESYLED